MFVSRLNKLKVGVFNVYWFEFELNSEYIGYDLKSVYLECRMYIGIVPCPCISPLSTFLRA